MCGRYQQADRGELAPANMGVVWARGADGEIKSVTMRWGLEPGWMAEPPAKPPFNARSETAHEKPMFREAFAKRRCLVPADDFYEWTGQPGRKTRWRFAAADGGELVFAGLWERRREGATLRLTYTVLTVAANADVAPYHDRMPAILAPQDREAWLDPAAELESLRALLQPAPDGTLAVEKG